MRKVFLFFPLFALTWFLADTDKALSIAIPQKKDDAKTAEKVEPTATDDWYCSGRDAAHTYTSKDNLPTPLRYKWHWTVEPKARTYQVLSTDGIVMVKGIGGSSRGVHNWILDMETGQQTDKDPDKTTPNDFVEGWPGGMYGGKSYQTDDGGYPYPLAADVWGPLQIDPDQKIYTFTTYMRGDGPAAVGIYCFDINKRFRIPNRSEPEAKWIYEGYKWYYGLEVKHKDWNKYANTDGANTAIGPGVVYGIIEWKGVKDKPELKSGLTAFELETGKVLWNQPGKYDWVSAGPDFCVAVSGSKQMSGFDAKTGKQIFTTKLSASLETNPMVVEGAINTFGTNGMLSFFSLTKKDEKYTLRPAGGQGIGKYDGPRMKVENRSFCYSADGTLYVANGTEVVGTKKGEKPWKWRYPKEILDKVGKLGNPIIARGKLLVAGERGCICFEHDPGDAK